MGGPANMNIARPVIGLAMEQALGPPLISVPASIEQRARIAAYAMPVGAPAVEVRSLWRKAYYTGRSWNESHPDGPRFKAWPFVYKNGCGLRPVDLSWIALQVDRRLLGDHEEWWIKRQRERGRKGGVAKGRARRTSQAGERAEAHRLKADGLSVRSIAKRLDRPRSTVHRWLNQGVPPGQYSMCLVFEDEESTGHGVLHTPSARPWDPTTPRDNLGQVGQFEEWRDGHDVLAGDGWWQLTLDLAVTDENQSGPRSD